MSKETELRLGFFVNGFDKKICVEGKVCEGLSKTDEKLSGYLLKEKNEGFGAKRWLYNETIKDGIDNSWGSRHKQETKAIFSPNPQQMNSTPLAPPRASPVVGWPPIRSFRRNIASPPKPEMESKPIVEDSKKCEDLYVKVNIEGYAIGRKINLLAHDSYESLSLALQKMFDNFLSVNFSKKNKNEAKDEEGIVSSEHVLIYEDNEGDRMLVGDVPWEMFVSTVKRLYIISGSKAPSTVTEREGKKTTVN